MRSGCSRRACPAGAACGWRTCARRPSPGGGAAARRPFDDPVEKASGLLGRARQPVVEGVLHRGLDDARRLGGREPVLGLADELRLPHEDREQPARRRHHVVGRHLRHALVPDHLAVGLQRARQRDPEALLVGAALRRRDGVAVGVHEAVAGEPGDRPFHRAVPAGAGLAGEDVVGDAPLALQRLDQVVLEAAGELEHRLGRRRLALDQRRIAGPADLDAAEEIGLGARHLEEARRVEARVVAEDLRVRLEADARAAAVHGLAELLQRALGHTAREALAVELARAGDLDLEFDRERVHPRRRRRRAGRRRSRRPCCRTCRPRGACT